MADKFIIAVLGVLCGGVLHGAIYDIKLANMNVHFANQLGMVIPGEVKFGVGIILFLVLALFVFTKNKKEENV